MANEAKSSSHAREPDVTRPDQVPTMPTEITERVSYVADLMAELRWVRGKTGKAIAKAWSMSQSSIDGYAAEASRRVTADAAEIRREITVRGLRRLAEAEDDKSFAAVGKLLADVSGANAPEKHEVIATTASPAEAARLIRQEFGEKALPNETRDPEREESSAIPEAPSGE